jgi:hypothetical protein
MEAPSRRWTLRTRGSRTTTQVSPLLSAKIVVDVADLAG